MKRVNTLILSLFLLFASAATCLADDLTADSLEGKWLFTHMVLDGTREMKVNRAMEFRPNNTVINYDAVGNERGRASYEVSGGRIIYQDQNGQQEWKVVSFGEEALHVDHRGAEMFFQRQ